MITEYRLDGSNFAANPLWDAAGSAELRLAPARFGAGNTLAAGENTRTISNVVVQGQGDATGPPFSGLMYAFGQFLDHDLDLTSSDKINHIDITIPADDPSITPGSIISLTRSKLDAGTGTQVNSITGWLDGSQVYGSSSATNDSLRTHSGGRLLTSDQGNLPIVNGNVVAGDVRANENPDLTAIQVVWLREHNAWADKFSAAHPDWSDEQIFQAARSVVIAEMQNVVYSEYLPLLLGAAAPGQYHGFDPHADPRISQEFAGAAFRFGHTIVSGQITAIDNAGEVTTDQTLQASFGEPAAAFEATGAGGLLRSLSSEFSNKFDPHLTEALRTFLADPAGQDLAAVNMQRGRDLGLGTLNETRVALGLTPYASFADLTSDPTVAASLAQVYPSIDDVELWIGGLSEAPAPGALVGETFQTIIARQFEAVRDGDPLWFENQGFSPSMLAQIKGTTFSDIILRNTDTDAIQSNVFLGTSRHASDVASDNPASPQLVVGVDADNAVIAGGDFDDTLVAGAGLHQALTGGAGRDTFQFLASAGADTVTDFTPGEDTLDFEAAVARGLTFDDVSLRSDAAGSAVVTVGQNAVTLAGVAPEALSARDFLFDTHAGVQI